MTFSELEEVLHLLNVQEPEQILDLIAWTRKQSTLDSLLERLQFSKSSLNLMITILNWKESS